MALRFFALALAALAASSAFSMEDAGPGVSATSAAAVPAAPTLVTGKSTIPADTTTTITWNSTNALYCNAGGNANALQTGWHGRLSTTGTYTVTPISVGSYAYTLYCVNAVGSSPTTTATLTVTPSPYAGNVGALDPWSLLGLALGVVLLRQRTARPAPAGPRS